MLNFLHVARSCGMVDSALALEFQRLTIVLSIKLVTDGLLECTPDLFAEWMRVADA